MEVLFSPLIKVLIRSTTLVNRKLSKLNKANISIDELSQALELTSDESNEDTDILEGIIKFGNIYSSIHSTFSSIGVRLLLSSGPS